MESNYQKSELVQDAVREIELTRKKRKEMRRIMRRRLTIAYLLVVIISALFITQGVYCNKQIAKLQNQVIDNNTIMDVEAADEDNINLTLLASSSLPYINDSTGLILTEDISVPENPKDTESTIPEKYSAVPLNDDLKSFIYNSAKEANIPPEILFAMAWKESTYNPNAVSSTNDHGLFQINKINFERLSIEFYMSESEFAKNIYDPYLNTKAAIYILKEYKTNYRNDNWHHVLMRYNMGPGGAQKQFKKGVYSSDYSRKIINYAKQKFCLESAKI